MNIQRNNPAKYQKEISILRGDTENLLNSPGMADKFLGNYGFLPKAIYRSHRNSRR